MPFIRIQAFSGLTPRTGERLLPDNGATKAGNVLLLSGEIRPIRKPLFDHTPSGSGPWVSIYRAEYNGVSTWMAWDKDVDIALAPLSADVEPRYYWTGDYEPRYAKFTGLPSTYFSLGVPNPLAIPSFTQSGGVSATTVSRLYVYTFFSALGEESGPSPATELVSGKLDASWVIGATAAMEATPPNSGDITALTYVGSSVTITTTNTQHNRVGERVVISGVTTVTNVNGTWTLTAVNAAAKTQTFTVTTAPTGVYNNATDTTDTWTRAVAWNTSGMKRRLYRSAGTNATYQLVADDVGTSYTDTLTDAQILGDELISASWELPPVGLTGIVALANGANAGFVGRQLRFSEPYQPHAWPSVYGVGTDFEIVGIEAYGTTVVAATAANPYVIDGVEPASATPQKINHVWPCLSKRSMVSLGDGVLYSTLTGLAFVGASGADIWTRNLYTQEEWKLLNPSTMIATVTNGSVFLGYTPDSGVSAMLEFSPGEESVLTGVGISCTELYTDPRNGYLYIVDTDGASQWNADAGEFMSYVWESKEIELPKPENFGVAKVDFVSSLSAADRIAAQANYDAAVVANAALIAAKVKGAYGDYAFGEIEVNGSNLVNPLAGNLDSLAFTLFAGGVERFTRLLFNDEPFRLPPGYKSDTVKIRVSGTVQVKVIKMAGNLRELKQG